MMPASHWALLRAGTISLSRARRWVAGFMSCRAYPQLRLGRRAVCRPVWPAAARLAAGRPAPPPPDDLSVGWVAALGDAALWADAAGTLAARPGAGRTRPSSSLDPQDGPRLHVQDPYSGADSWLDALQRGPDRYARARRRPAALVGAVVRRRREPAGRSQYDSAPALGELPVGRPIVVSGWVVGEEVVKDNPTWAVLSGTACTCTASVLRPVASARGAAAARFGAARSRTLDRSQPDAAGRGCVRGRQRRARGAHVDGSAGLGDRAGRLLDPAPGRERDDGVHHADRAGRRSAPTTRSRTCAGRSTSAPTARRCTRTTGSRATSSASLQPRLRGTGRRRCAVSVAVG